METDSDDFVPDPPKVSQLTRKKKKKDTKPKMKTSSQVPSSEVAVSRKSPCLSLNIFNFLSLQLLWKEGDLRGSLRRREGLKESWKKR